MLSTGRVRLQTSLYDCFLLQSYQFPDVSDAVDLARLRMMRVMKEKQEYWGQVKQCRADGSCPAMSVLRSGGPAECVDVEYSCPF